MIGATFCKHAFEILLGQGVLGVFLVLVIIYFKGKEKKFEEMLKAKEKSMIAYKQLFPHGPIPHGPRGGAIDHNIMDALLVGTYGILKYSKTEILPWVFDG